MRPRRPNVLDLHDHSTPGQGPNVLGSRVDVATSVLVGATGLGVVDERPAIQAAIDAKNTAGGGTVWLAPGDYLIGSPGLIVYSKVTLCGWGDQSRLFPAASANYPLISFGTSVDNNTPVVSDLFLDGTGVSGLGTSQDGIQVNRATRARIHHCHVRLMGGIGINVATPPTGGEEHVNWIDHNIVELCKVHGIYVGANCFDTVIEANEVGGSGYTTWPDPSGYGSGGTADNIHIANAGSLKIGRNHCHQASRYNYYIGGSGDTVLTGNFGEKSVSHSYVIDTSSNCVLTGNFAREVDRLVAGGIDCFYIVDSDSCVVVGNRGKDGRYGCSVSRTAAQTITHNHVVGNNFTGTTSGATYFQVEALHLHNAPLGTGGVTYGPRRIFVAFASVAIASMLNSAVTTFAVTVPGAILGDPVLVGIENIGANALLVSGQVTAANTVTVTLENRSGGTLTYGTQTVRVICFQVDH